MINWVALGCVTGCRVVPNVGKGDDELVCVRFADERENEHEADMWLGPEDSEPTEGAWYMMGGFVRSNKSPDGDRIFTSLRLQNMQEVTPPRAQRSGQRGFGGGQGQGQGRGGRAEARQESGGAQRRNAGNAKGKQARTGSTDKPAVTRGNRRAERAPEQQTEDE